METQMTRIEKRTLLVATLKKKQNGKDDTY